MKKIVILIVLIVLTIVISIASIIIRGNNKYKNKYENSIKTLANDFYIEKFYPEHQEIVKKMAVDNSEITFSLYDILTELGYDNDLIQQTEFYKECDVYTSMIRYRLNLPASSNSFTLKMDLMCN